MSTFGERLLSILSGRDWSQVDFARRSGVSAMEINHIIKGRREPSMLNLRRIVFSLPKTINLRWLICGEVKRHEIPAGHMEALWKSAEPFVTR